MNLLFEPWIPVCRTGGQLDWISPIQMSETDLISLDSSRPDFNGTLVQLLIGLLQSTTPMDSHSQWQKWYEQPPSTEELKSWFAPVAAAFEFNGEEARFMQDFSLRTEGVVEKEFNDIAALLIESPGDNTLKENKDHFIKRGTVSGLCPRCAAAALYTLQANAPGGGNGHFTSIRGGGPLTTLIIATPVRSLWHNLWLNVRERSQFLATGGDVDLTELHFLFPWMADQTAIQPAGGKTAPVQVHPSHVFWGMPRRIRLDLENLSAGVCNVCLSQSEKIVTRYLTKAKGFDYKGAWNHPLSPYYESKPGEYLPVHPGVDGFGYRHWLGWVLGLQRGKRHVRPASIVSHIIQGSRLRKQQLRLWAFGYDMDNMKARCWYESTFPLYGLADCDYEDLKLVQAEVGKWLEAADQVAFMLRSAVKSAWFSDGADVKGDWGFIDSSFWSRTELNFYQILKALISGARSVDEEPKKMELAEQWRGVLIRSAIRLFEADLVGAASIERQNPRRVAESYRRLRSGLYSEILKATLGLPSEVPAKRSKKVAKSA